MRPLPTRRCVRTEPGVDHGDRGFIVLILKIPEKLAELSDEEHSLIHDRAARERDHIRVITALLEHTPHHIQPAVKGNPLLDPLRTRDESLHDIRHTVHSRLAQHLRMDRDLSPAEEIQSFLLYDHLKDILRLVPLQLILREKEHPHTVVPLSAETDPQRFTDF